MSRLPADLHVGVLLERRNRFVADVRLDDGAMVQAHCPNTGRMTGCARPGWRVALSRSNNPGRKLPYTWELTHNGTCWIGVNTWRANHLARAAIAAGTIPELTGYNIVLTEQPYGANSRIDLLLRSSQTQRPDCYVEVKNVTLVRDGGIACFPDAVSVRGRKHLVELQAAIGEGLRAVMLFVIQRPDAHAFRPAFEVDPAYAAALREACDSGVEALAYKAAVSPEEVVLTNPVPVSLTACKAPQSNAS